MYGNLGHILTEPLLHWFFLAYAHMRTHRHMCTHVQTHTNFKLFTVLCIKSLNFINYIYKSVFYVLFIFVRVLTVSLTHRFTISSVDYYCMWCIYFYNVCFVQKKKKIRNTSLSSKPTFVFKDAVYKFFCRNSVLSC